MHISSVYLTHKSSDIQNFQIKENQIIKGYVVREKNDGTYLVNIAGKTVSAKSNVPLSSGQVFSAQVKFLEQKLMLKIINEPHDKNMIQNLLTKLNVSDCPEAERLLSLMIKTGVKVDGKKIRKSAVRLLQQESESEENDDECGLSLLMLIKGMGKAVKTVKYLQREKYFNETKNKSSENEQSVRKEGNNINLLKNYVQSASDAVYSNKEGGLTVFNSLINASDGQINNHWVVLPFQWGFNAYSGTFKILYNISQKLTHQIKVQLSNEKDSYAFDFELKANKITKVLFAKKGGFTDSQVSFFKELFTGALKELSTIECVSYDEICGFGVVCNIGMVEAFV